ncbi:MAG TPA: hypothetical protein VMU16_13305 [Candidatus Binataceae bacterium]|nr:hypothetical protein [Candidatus Binataceae bacterium]
MVVRPYATLSVAAGLIAAAILVSANARAIEVKKDLWGKGGSSVSPMPAAQEQQLKQVIADESDKYVSEESEKKSNGQPYVDIQDAKMMYIPRSREGTWYVEAKLEASEYLPTKKGEGKGKPTGMRKALLFKYKLDGGKWVETENPRWLEYPPPKAQ